MLYKNEAEQRAIVFAWDAAGGAPKTGDAANITAYISKDADSPAQSDDVNPTELDATNMPGVYVFSLTQAETNCDLFVLVAKSSTSDVHIGPVVVYTADGRISEAGGGGWDDLTSGMTTPGSIGKLLADYIDAAISSRMAEWEALTADRPLLP